MEKIKFIYGDLSRTYDYDENIIGLNTLGTNRDLKRHGIKLEKNKEYWFYVDDVKNDPLIYEAKVDFDERAKRWIAKIKPESIKQLSESKFAKDYLAKEIEGEPLKINKSKK